MKRLIYPGVAILLFAVFLTLQPGPRVSAAPGHEASFRIGAKTYIADNQLKAIDVAPYLENGRAYIPVRFLASALGIPDDGITWDEATRSVTIAGGDKLLKLTIGSNILLLGNRTFLMDVVPQLKEGRVMLPARWVAEALGYAVTWEEGSQTVRIAPPGSRTQDGAGSLPNVGSYENLKSLLAGNLQHSPGLYGRDRAGGDDGIMVTQDVARESLSTEAPAPAPAAGGAAETMKSKADFSTTNLQVEGVDEADIVKTDGTYIYQVNRERLIIARAYPAEDMKVVSTLDYGNKGFSPQEIYVDEKHLIVIGQTSATVARPMDSISRIYPPYYWNRETVKAIIYDIRDKSNVRQVRELELSGHYLSSRKIGQSFYLVANKNIYYYPGQEIDEPRPLYRDSAVQDGFVAIDYPEIRCFPDFVEPNYLIVAGLNLGRPEQKASVSCYLGSGQNVYASPENLYVALTSYRYRIMPVEAKTLSLSPASTTSTSIYRFKLEDGSLTYTGKGEVPGSILNQFSMDEYNNYFRIATTQGESWRTDEYTSRNNLYILDSDLKIAGKIEDIAPGERIYSVRFTGNRAYMVTFKNVDPFFVLDLSDPHQPEILGALKIPGYSDYLHPYDENHVIGFGKDTVEVGAKGGMGDGSMAFYLGMKMALFDVSDVKNPVEMFRENIGDRGTDSELLRNHKALLFSKEKNLLAFPVTVMETGQSGGRPGSPFPEYGQFTFQGAYVYSLDLNKGFVLKGRITHLTEEDYLKAGSYWYDSEKNIERILYINENLYTLSKKMLKANRMENLQEVGSLVLR
ncbi:MAG TPA: beta-propeller domain-containing protein [Bacillota bacterium]|jgi:uncharacterized secreted protein with C-terminal beta-propeller domain|nr:beta-propeller domain-containing protein [Peptococcaceae bacterium MAG4]NLW37459.1 hypothetical protein [Peptococcaceae bacterium]HPU35504.1 beta-propeller domain-containing protein [Bacillota bacterium]HPZ43774.1 beta-propeller domain-containing protein [Bacillota bacterium]HQD76195.1 beta-propeller domain-containing protein [Bacillota bacterium]